MNAESDHMSAVTLTAPTSGPSTEAPNDPLHVVLAEMRKLEHRMEERHKSMGLQPIMDRFIRSKFASYTTSCSDFFFTKCCLNPGFKLS